MRRSARILIGLGLVLSLTGCEANWGEKIRDFVNNRVYGLSRSFAEADLATRWQVALSAASMDARVTLNLVSRSVADLQLPVVTQETGIPEGLAALRSYGNLLRDLSSLERGVLEAREGIVAAEELCRSERLYVNAGLDQSGLNSLQDIVLPQDEAQIHVGNDWSALFKTIFFWVGEAERREQRDIAESAIREYPRRVVQSAELFEISQRTCREAVASAAEDLAEHKAALDTAVTSLRSIQSDILASFRRVEAHVLPETYEQLLALSGAQATVLETLRAQLSHRRSLQLQLLRNELRNLRARAGQSTTCSRAITRLGDYEDALVEAELQWDSIQGTILVPEVAEQFRRFGQELQAARGELRSLWGQAGGAACA